MKTQEAPNYTIGQELLRKAVTREKEASRYYGQYVQWAAEDGIPLEAVTTQLIEAKGWARVTARKHATGVKLLAEPENREHLEALLNGEISFVIACMRANPPAHRSKDYQDEEAAIMYLHKAVNIMAQRHKQWTQKDILTWIMNICAETLKKTSHAKETKGRSNSRDSKAIRDRDVELFSIRTLI